MAIVSDSERDKSMVQELWELKAKVDLIIIEAFDNNEKLHGVVRESFESVVNRRQNKPAELIGRSMLFVLASAISFIHASENEYHTIATTYPLT